MSNRVSVNVEQIMESPYVLGTRKSEDLKLIDVTFPDDWIIPERLFPENSPILIATTEQPNIFIFYSKSKTFSDIFTVINAIVQYNKEREEKVLIFNKLQVELQKYFEELALSEFKKLRLTGVMIQPITPPKDVPPPQEEPIIENKDRDGEVLKP